MVEAPLGKRLGLDELEELVQQAQVAGDDAFLQMCDARIAAQGGPFAAQAGVHFVKVVALVVRGDLDGSLAAIRVMADAQECVQVPAWRACALAVGAMQGGSLGLPVADSSSGQSVPFGAFLRDLARAEVALEADDDLDALATFNAHTACSVAYDEHGLFELSVPHREFLLGPDAPQGAVRNVVISGFNLASTHLKWASELRWVGDLDGCAEHLDEARRASEQLLRDAGRPGLPDAGMWQDLGRLARACALADGPDAADAAAQMTRLRPLVLAHGVNQLELMVAMSLPIALSRSGRAEEALRVATLELSRLGENDPWQARASLAHTCTQLWAEQGSPGAAAGLQFGRRLAEEHWRERDRSTHAVRAMRELESIQQERTLFEQVAISDALTGVLNRRGFDQRVAALVAVVDGPPCAVLVLDLDRFKQVNDTYGHGAGDEELTRVAQAARAAVRADDVVARIGGDEFMVLLPGSTAAQARRVGRRIVDNVAASAGYGVGVSVGVAVRPCAELAEAMAAADAAMYEAKRAGGGRVSVAP